MKPTNRLAARGCDKLDGPAVKTGEDHAAQLTPGKGDDTVGEIAARIEHREAGLDSGLVEPDCGTRKPCPDHLGDFAVVGDMRFYFPDKFTQSRQRHCHECVGLIALFDDAGKLVNAVNVRGDIHISFGENYVRPLGANGALVIAHNWHDNSEQSYDLDLISSSSNPTASRTSAASSHSASAVAARGPAVSSPKRRSFGAAAGQMPMARIDAGVNAHGAPAALCQGLRHQDRRCGQGRMSTAFGAGTRRRAPTRRTRETRLTR